MDLVQIGAASIQRKGSQFDDEAVLARFGKKQQLRVRIHDRQTYFQAQTLTWMHPTERV